MSGQELHDAVGSQASRVVGPTGFNDCEGDGSAQDLSREYFDQKTARILSWRTPMLAACGWGQLILQLAALSIAGYFSSSRSIGRDEEFKVLENKPAVLRFVFAFIAALATLASLSGLRQSGGTVAGLRHFIQLRYLSLLCEFALYTFSAAVEQFVILGTIIMFFNVVAIVVAAFAVRRVERFAEHPDLNEQAATSLVVVLRSSQQGHDSTVRQWQRWYCATRVREVMLAYEAAGRRTLLVLLLVTFATLVGHVAYELYKTFSNDTAPLLSKRSNDRFNDPAISAKYMPQRTHQRYKVHIVVLDGLRYDLTEPGASAIGDFFDEPGFRNSSVRFLAQAQLPSFSVPNWMSLLTGAKPETHGVTGNLLNGETSFDHIFRQAKRYGLHAGLTGTPWWKDLVFSTLPSLDGDGTIAADLPPPPGIAYPYQTSDPADDARLEVALQAMRRSRVENPFGTGDVRFLYDLFLTHFSDIDKQGHEYGIDTEWNKGDTYTGAIKNKTAALRRIVAAMDGTTILLITSDHGHVHRGGHGGSSKELRNVPVVFFSKALPLRALVEAQVAPVFPATATPRSTNGGFSNLDISATVSALLGIPVPRQSGGIFFEEVLMALLPATTLLRHYHDLFLARLSFATQFSELLTTGLFGGAASSAFIKGSQAQELAETNGTASPLSYGDGIRRSMEATDKFRDAVMTFYYARNCVCAAVALVMAPFFLYASFSTNRVLVQFRAVTLKQPTPHDVDGVLITKNSVACLAALVTVVLYIALSVAAFLITYFAVTGYTVWDSTLVHTPSVAGTFLAATLGWPSLIFVVLTRFYLAQFLVWHVPKAIRTTGTKSWLPLAILNAVQRDLFSIFVAPSEYSTNQFTDAYMYMTYLAIFSCAAGWLAVLVAFPVVGVLPVVFSMPFIDEMNLEFRFRMVTIWLILFPLLIGNALLIVLRPRDKPATRKGWHHLIRCTFFAAYRRDLTSEQSDATEAGDDKLVREMQQRIELLDSADLLMSEADAMVDPLGIFAAPPPSLAPPPPPPPAPLSRSGSFAPSTSSQLTSTTKAAAAFKTFQRSRSSNAIEVPRTVSPGAVLPAIPEMESQSGTFSGTGRSSGGVNGGSADPPPPVAVAVAVANPILPPNVAAVEAAEAGPQN